MLMKRIIIERERLRNDACKGYGEKQSEDNQSASGDSDAEVSVSFVSNAEIRNLNRIYRKKDSVTDVLSFPLGVDGKYDISKETGCALLGDVVISLETAMRQADLYGHSLEREIGFLTVHSMLHLLGYDHETSPLEARKMREKEEQVLGELGISREETFVSEE